MVLSAGAPRSLCLSKRVHRDACILERQRLAALWRGRLAHAWQEAAPRPNLDDSRPQRERRRRRRRRRHRPQRVRVTEEHCRAAGGEHVGGDARALARVAAAADAADRRQDDRGARSECGGAGLHPEGVHKRDGAADSVRGADAKRRGGVRAEDRCGCVRERRGAEDADEALGLRRGSAATRRAVLEELGKGDGATRGGAQALLELQVDGRQGLGRTRCWRHAVHRDDASHVVRRA
mmetsp:Transcript_39582/g.124953  ORF Transcript_39582/g.124953 Transcript_39582/m.124953 type:complete len:236 (-) Transcript_39582:340-1047(-)